MTSARVISVIETVCLIGDGKDDNPYRNVKDYWTQDGELLATVDEWLIRKLTGNDVRKLSLPKKDSAQ